MSRIDVPTMKCDRCGMTTQDLPTMARFQKLEHPHMSGNDRSGTDRWDLCTACWHAFSGFVEREAQ